jgi:putative ABC transport system permease protein
MPSSHTSRGKDGAELATKEQRRPEWGGFVGILSAGFASAAGLTMFAFVLDALASLRLRFVEFGVLRAIGLSMGQMASVVLIRQMLVALYGTSVGTAIGIGVSHLYVPHLAIGGSFGGSVPPILVRIAWSDISAVYIALLLALEAITLLTVLALRRARFFEAIKLGQTT